MKRKILNILLSLALIIPLVSNTANAENTKTPPTDGDNTEVDNSEFVLSNGLDLTKEVLPYGNAKDRIYQVNLTVEGQLETIVQDAEVFLLIDVTKLNAGVGNMAVWPYYLRAIWNMCDYLVSTYDSRTFNFYLIAVDNKNVPLINGKKFTVRDDDRSQLGDPDNLYVKLGADYKPLKDEKGSYIPVQYPKREDYLKDENGNDRTETEIDKKWRDAIGQLYRNYNNDILIEESLLGYLSNLSYFPLPNRTDSVNGSMDFLDKGLMLETSSSNYAVYGGGNFLPRYASAIDDEANVELALKTMNDIIENNNLGNSQAIMLMDTVPSVYHENEGDIINPESIPPILNKTYSQYEYSKELNVLFHMFALDTFTSQQTGPYIEMWTEFTTMIGQNRVRKLMQSINNGTILNASKYIPFEWEVGKVSENNLFSSPWSHEEGANVSEEQKNTSRLNLNSEMQRVAASVGSGITDITSFANFVYVQDQIPRAFHVLNYGAYKPLVSTSLDKGNNWIVAGNDVVERTDIYPENSIGNDKVPSAVNRWKDSGIRWKLRELTTKKGIYKFTFYMKANEDYFGSEYIDANDESGIYYMTYDQWKMVGSPPSDNIPDAKRWKKENFTKEDFIYKIEARTENGKTIYEYKYTNPEKKIRMKNPSISKKEEDIINDKVEDYCDINVYVPWSQDTSDGEITIFYGDSAKIVKSDQKCKNKLNKWLVPETNDPDKQVVMYYFDQYAKIHEQLNYDYIGTSNERVVEEAVWKDKNGEELMFDYEWIVHTNEDIPKYSEVIFEGENKSLEDIMIEFDAEPDATVTYELRYWLHDPTKLDWKYDDTGYPVLGEWKPVAGSGSEQTNIPLYDSTIANVLVNVEYGSITLSKEIVSSIVDDDELKKIDFKTGFPVSVTSDNGFVSVPTIRQTENGSVTLSGLKRGTYSLEEILPQKFKFKYFLDEQRGYVMNEATENPYINSIYTFEIGFDQEKNNLADKVLKDNTISLTNDFYINKWYTTTQDMENVIKSSNKLNENLSTTKVVRNE